MLSRAADNLYWMARYLERAENMARLVDTTAQFLLDAGLSADSRSSRCVTLMRTSSDPGKKSQTFPFLSSSFSTTRTVTVSGSALPWHGKMPGWSATSCPRKCGES